MIELMNVDNIESKKCFDSFNSDSEEEVKNTNFKHIESLQKENIKLQKENAELRQNLMELEQRIDAKLNCMKEEILTQTIELYEMQNNAIESKKELTEKLFQNYKQHIRSTFGKKEEKMS